MKVLTPKLIREHAQHMIARDPLPGVDGVSAAQVSADINTWLAPTIADLGEGTYAPQPYLRFWLTTPSKFGIHIAERIALKPTRVE